MLSKGQIKYVQALHSKKYRILHNAFIVEGAKSVLELLESNFTIEKHRHQQRQQNQRIALKARTRC